MPDTVSERRATGMTGSFKAIKTECKVRFSLQEAQSTCSLPSISVAKEFPFFEIYLGNLIQMAGSGGGLWLTVPEAVDICNC